MATSDAIMLDVDGRAVRLSSPNKPYFPDLNLSKLDVAHYVMAVAPGMLAALKDRPTTMERWPGGVLQGAVMATRDDPHGDAFYQKRTPRGAPDWVQRATITFPSGRTAETVAPSDAATLVWMVNLGTLRFHAWPVRASAPNTVDQLRIDLDPQPGTDFADAARAATELRAVLDEAGLVGFPKTSGGRGLHVFVPIEPRQEFTIVRRGVIALARELERRAPAQVTSSWWKEERGERIFIDYNQAARDRTMAAAYSARRTPIATVSTPVTWAELADVHPDDCTIATVPGLLARRGDPMAGMRERPGGLDRLLELAERDAAAGLGEMPYPPNYPKMPGEPPRVPPSKAAGHPPP